MILAVLAGGAAGILIGIVTGITPGIHINTITAILISSIGYFTNIPLIALVAFVVALAVSHTILDFIPSILTGAPDEESFLSVLPGDEMLKEGKEREGIAMI